MKVPEFFIKHIIAAIAEIESYTTNIDKQTFLSEPMRYNATIRQIEIIGEAISHLESNFKDQYPNIPWQAIKDMRNILIHEYWQTDVLEIYNTVKSDIPELKKLILPILQDLESKNETSSH